MKTRILISLLFIIPISLISQSFSGQVVDESQFPIQGALILNINTSDAIISGPDGSFELDNSSISDTIQVSLIGYETKRLAISSFEEDIRIILVEKNFTLEEVIISPKLNAQQIITEIDIQTNPVNSSQEILRKVPGLFIGQHAGGGKAEQIFLRGFDIDHGTDINISVDGLPINMVSHAHGQGYADLHFIIPETVDKIDFGKGLYYQDKGNFTTAGYVDFRTKEKLKASTIKLEAGLFNTSRLLGMFNLVDNGKQSAYVATEVLSTDGYFESPQNFNRINLFGKYTNNLSSQDKFGITLSHFDSKWDASGQIPQRSIDDGSITRFGAIDDTEGGGTSRTNFLVTYDKILDETSSIKNSVYINRYDFELFSNFTFFLEDPINGDQIKQREERVIYGANSEYYKSFISESFTGQLKAGISLRNDQSTNNELSRTANRRETLERIQFGDVNETNIGAYLGANLEFGKWAINPSLRWDYFDFQYNDDLLPNYRIQTETKGILSPKFNVLYNPNQNLQLFFKSGRSFHSNDTRVVVAQEASEILPAAYGIDIGYLWKPTSDILVNMAYWYLFLDQEFVYVGDAGIVEPSGKTRRQGIETSIRYQPQSWFYWNFDANYTMARSIDEEDGKDYIPLAPDFTLVSGFNFNLENGLYGSLNVRYLGDRPANEDNSIIAEGYTVTDLSAGYKWNSMSFGIQVQNLFDIEWNETQFATESRLINEMNPVEEIHFTPGTPFFLRAVFQYDF